MVTGIGRYGMPPQATPLLGRDEALDESRALLLRPSVRLLTLTGLPGVGKTRLAIAVGDSVADRFPGGCRFVDLTTVQDVDSVMPAIADALDADGDAHRSPMQALESMLGDEDTLLVLDNFEHVVEAGRDISTLLAACPRLKLLITSRVPVRVSWEHQYAVLPLPLPEAECQTIDETLANPSAALFVERAKAVQPHLSLANSDASDLVDLCRRLEGLPLALELAAAQVKVFPLPEIASRLERRLAFLQNGPGNAPRRHATLRAAVGWSYSLLGPVEQAVFRRMGAFGGGCEFTAAEAVCTDAADAENATPAIAGLVEASLVQSVALSARQSRLQMLETIREYALECLVSSGEEAATRSRHAHYYRQLAADARTGLEGPDQRHWLDRLEADHGNVGLALRHFAQSGDVESAVSLAADLWRFWWMRGHLALGQLHLNSLVGHEQLALGSAGLARVLLCSGILAVWRSDYADGHTALREAAEMARSRGDMATVAYALIFLCRAARDLGNEDAPALGAESVRLLRDTEDRWGLGLALHFLGLALTRADPGAARQNFEESAAIFRALGDRGDLAMPLRGLGLIAYQDGDFAAARSLLEESATYFLERGDEWAVAMVAHDLGYVAYSQGRLEEAADRFAESLGNWRRLGNRRGQVSCVAGLAGVAAGIGRAAEAAVLLASADAITAETGVVLEPTDVATLGHIRAAIQAKGGKKPAPAGLQFGRLRSLDDAVLKGFEIAEAVSGAKPAGSASAGTRDPGVLTRREREIAALVREGLSNRQIAGALVISEGTAGLHVKHILAKLGFRSRAQVAVWAVEQGLEAPPARPGH